MGIFKEAPTALAPFTDDAQPQFRLGDFKGALLVIRVDGVDTVATKFGEKPVIKADILVVDDKGDPDEYKNVALFNAAVRDQLAEHVGEIVVARVGTYFSKKYGKEGLKLVPPSKADLKLADKALNTVD